MQVRARALFSSIRVLGASSYQRSGHGLPVSMTITTASGSRNSRSRPFGSVRSTTIPAVGGLLKSNSDWFSPSNPLSSPNGLANSGKAISASSDIGEVREFFRRMYENCRAKIFENGGSTKEVEQLLLMMKFGCGNEHPVLADIFFDAFKLCALSMKVQEVLGTPITFDTEDPLFALRSEENDSIIMIFKILGPHKEGLVTMEKKKQDDEEIFEYTSLGVFVDGVPVPARTDKK